MLPYLVWTHLLRRYTDYISSSLSRVGIYPLLFSSCWFKFTLKTLILPTFLICKVLRECSLVWEASCGSRNMESCRSRLHTDRIIWGWPPAVAGSSECLKGCLQVVQLRAFSLLTTAGSSSSATCVRMTGRT